MDWLKLPPLNSLRAFSAVAETGSYTVAATQLNVTQAAVSQQVKALEKRLDVGLVTRLGRGIVLTDAGTRLARELNIGFEAIGRGVTQISDNEEQRPVQVTMSPAFAVEWLLPRISEFQQKHPEITLMLNPTSDMVELKPGGIDVAIRYHDKRRPRNDEDTVLVSDMIVVGTPALIAGRDLSNPAALTEMPWLQELGTNEVAEWLTYHGVVPERPLALNHMPGNLIMSAVRRGDGITYTSRAFFRDDLAEGKLIELFSERLFGVYYIEKPQGYERPAARTFLNWLRSQAETVTV